MPTTIAAYAVKTSEAREDDSSITRIELWNVNRRTTITRSDDGAWYMFDAQGNAGEIVAQFGETEDGRLFEMPL